MLCALNFPLDLLSQNTAFLLNKLVGFTRQENLAYFEETMKTMCPAITDTPLNTKKHLGTVMHPALGINWLKINQVCIS